MIRKAFGPVFRKALLILSGNAFASLLLLARTLIIARLISVEDFGIAATFALSMAIVEMMSALGLQQQIVQARDGNDPRLQAGLQGFQVLRGVLAGAVLFLLAGPIARFLNVEHVTWAYQLLALVPVLNALVHFDIYRMNRTMMYLPGILTGVVPAGVSLAIVWPLAMWFGDWRVMLWSILAQAVLTAVMSHLVAERPYRLLFDRQIMAQSFRFGWPLLANGVLLFLVFNGEKLIVGRELGMAELAIFSMGITLTLTPTLVMAKSLQTFFLPQLSAVHAHAQAQEGFGSLARATVQAGMLVGTVLVVAVLLFGDPLVHLLLGPKYAGLTALLTGLTVVQALRVFKAGSSIAALACGQTGNAVIANLLRVALLPVAWFVLHQGGGLTEVIWIAIAGEAIGFAVSLLLVRYRIGVRMRPLLLSLLIAAAPLGLAAYHSTGQLDRLDGLAMNLQIVAVAMMLLGALILTMRDLRRFVSLRIMSGYSE
jgi:O-antigen/teichoic acid export membrane protein